MNPLERVILPNPVTQAIRRLPGLEVITLLLLGIECYKNAPNERFHTVRGYAVDSFSVRRLSARIPSTYICTLLRSTKKAAPNEPVGEITVGQTPYYNLSDDQELESILARIARRRGQESETTGIGLIHKHWFLLRLAVWTPADRCGERTDLVELRITRDDGDQPDFHHHSAPSTKSPMNKCYSRTSHQLRGHLEIRSCVFLPNRVSRDVSKSKPI